MGVTVPDFLWELSVGDQKARDVVGVEETDEAVDFRVHDGLAHQRESAVFDFQALPVALRFHSRDTWGRKKRESGHLHLSFHPKPFMERSSMLKRCMPRCCKIY